MRLAVEVWRLKLDKTSAFILMALCDSADDDGTACFPKAKYVAWKTGSSLPTVYRKLTDLEAQRIIVQVGMRGDTPEYEIHLENAPVKPDYMRPRRGRPRKKASHGEKTFSPRENILTVRKGVSPRQNISHGEKNTYHREKQEHRLGTSETQAASGVASKQDVADPSYRPILLTQLKDPSGVSSTLLDKPEDADSDLHPAPGTWRDTLAKLAPTMTPAQLASWLKPGKLFTNDAGYVLVFANASTAEQAKVRYLDRIRRELGADVEVRVRV